MYVTIESYIIVLFTVHFTYAFKRIIRVWSITVCSIYNVIVTILCTKQYWYVVIILSYDTNNRASVIHIT